MNTIELVGSLSYSIGLKKLDNMKYSLISHVNFHSTVLHKLSNIIISQNYNKSCPSLTATNTKIRFSALQYNIFIFYF